MSTEVANKQEIIKKFARGATDTGSPEVQVAILTERLSKLAKHFSGHAKDNHSQKGMMRLVEKRKRLLSYLKTENFGRYKTLIESLDIRK